jgi:hypothetical protein
VTIFASHQHTYFLFPFSLDKDAIIADHPEIWTAEQGWFEALDRWVTTHIPDRSPIVEQLGTWKRSAYTRFDLDSQAYQDMVFFHPFVRRVFFDTAEWFGDDPDQEALLRCYTIPVPEGQTIKLRAEDGRGRASTVEVTDLRLFLFVNGIGILSIGAEAVNLPVSECLWINEMMRKVYASSGRQVREGRIPSKLTLLHESAEGETELVEEDFWGGAMVAFLPPLSRTITELLYFADYAQQEFEPVLDERMIVYSYVALDPETLPAGYIESPEYQVFLSRFLYVDRLGKDYRYDSDFTQAAMQKQLYTRWAHQGTYYGFTSYSNVTATIGTFDCDEHNLREGFLIHRMFDTRYYLMAVVATFYRASLLDFAERIALVSKRIFRDFEDNRLQQVNIDLASKLRADFLHFANYWFFEELANKDEESDHFALACEAFRVYSMKEESEQEISNLNSALNEYYQGENTIAVNRLAMLSVIFGGGAVLTGYFGMNFGQEFDRLFFNPNTPWAQWLHSAMIVLVTIVSFGVLIFGLYLVVANWSTYGQVLSPGFMQKKRRAESIRRANSR